ncbi:MAG: hypothetical protein GY774_30080 [Planctomycetes bacterium]|nr:hypothetical protein [Planctomycetota bacterium]
MPGKRGRGRGGAGRGGHNARQARAGRGGRPRRARQPVGAGEQQPPADTHPENETPDQLRERIRALQQQLGAQGVENSQIQEEAPRVRQVDAMDQNGGALGTAQENLQHGTPRVTPAAANAAAGQYLMAPPQPAPLAAAEEAMVDPSGVTTALEELLGANSTFNTGDLLNGLLLDGSILDIKIKTKIWSGGYVELGSLIPRNENVSRINMRYVPGPNNQIAFTPAQSKQPASFQEWLSCFCIFATVYTEKYKLAAPQMFSYISRVQELSREEPLSYVWRQYDELFRKIKGLCPQLPWHVLQPQILSKARCMTDRIVMSTKRKFDPPARVQNKSKRSSSSYDNRQGNSMLGTCNIFNEGRTCPFKNCRYTHTCANCRGQHNRTQCTQASGSASGQK